MNMITSRPRREGGVSSSTGLSDSASLVRKSEVIDNLTTGGALSPLSAEQGKVLKTQLDAINDVTSVITDNGDGTFSHNNGAGVVVTFDSKRTVALDNGDGTFTITDDHGASVTITDNVAETLTSLTLVANILTYTDEAGTPTALDLSLYLDDTNLARIMSGTVDASGILTITRDDASTFTMDLSTLLPVGPENVIAPASDDGSGAAGSAVTYARGDHKHPAQDVSADAEQLLKVGSDGLHALDPDDLISSVAFNQIVKAGDGKLYSQTGAHVFITAATLAASDVANPTESEVTARAIAGPALAWYTGTDVGTDTVTHIWSISPAGSAKLIWETPAVSENIFNTDGTLTGPRTVELDGNAVNFEQAGDVKGAIDEAGFSAKKYGFVGVESIFATGTPQELSYSQGAYRFVSSNASTGNCEIESFTGNTGILGDVIVHLRNIDTIDRDFVFSSAFKGFDGATAIGTITQAQNNSGDRVLHFIKPTNTGQHWVLVADSDGMVSSGEASRLLEDVNQTAHGFSQLEAVHHDGTNWVKAVATDGDLDAHTIVTSVVDVDNFVITTVGAVTVTGHGLSVGEYYWLDQTTAGALTDVKPSTGVAQSLLYVRDANTLSISVEPSYSVVDAITVEPLSRIQVGLSATANDSGATHYGFDVTHFSDVHAVLSLSGTGSIQGLKAGKTYRLSAHLQLFPPSSGTGDAAQLRFVDLTANANIGPTDPIDLHPSKATHNQSVLPSAEVYFTPAVDSEVGIDFSSGSLGELGVRSTFLVEQLPETTVLPATAVEIDLSTAVDGDTFEWDAANAKLVPQVITEVNDTALVEATLNQTAGNSWVVTTSDNPANGKYNVNNANYYQKGKLRYYSIWFRSDNDDAISFEVTGADDVYGFAVNTSAGTFNWAAGATGKSGTNEITLDRLNTTDADHSVGITFVAKMA